MAVAVRHSITDGLFNVTLGDVPAVVGYSGEGILGLAGGDPPVVTLYDSSERKLLESGRNFDICYYGFPEDASVLYIGHISMPQGEVRFDICFRLEGGRFSIQWKCVQEKGLELVSIAFTRFISTVGSDPTGRLALTARGGRLVEPAACCPGRFEHRFNWIMDSFCGCSVMYNRDVTAVVRLNSQDDTLYSQVADSQIGKYAALGVSFRHRYTVADNPYRKVVSVGPLSCDPADAATYPVAESFTVHPSSTLDIFLYRRQSDPETGWVFGMKRLCALFPPKQTGIYRDRFVSKIYLGNLGNPKVTTFEQALDIIKSVWERTGGAKQICYLVGFQHDGHDSMYPDVFTANEKAGGMEKLLWLMREAGQFDAIVSFHDNYDDAYRQSPMWDENDIAVDNTGHLLKGGCWNGIQAYWNSLPQYSAAKSRARIERTLAQYPLHTTYHLDVLTASVFRLDFRAAAPMGKDDDLAARLKVIRQFRERGVDVSSEACGQPFMGEISYFWHMLRVPQAVYEGDRRIPAAPFLIHGKADYAGSQADGRGILDGLLYAAYYCGDVTAETPIKLLTDAFYLLFAPLNRLRDEEAVGYAEFSGCKKVTYSSGSSVQVNFESGEYEAVIDGRAWVRNGTAFIPWKNGRYIAYVACEDEFSTPVFELPEGWEGGTTHCRPLLGSGPEVCLQPEDGKLTFCLPIGVAYSVMAEVK